MVIHRSYVHSLYDYYHTEYVSLKKKKKIPFPRQISREGTDEKHMSFFVWPNINHNLDLYVKTIILKYIV